MNFHLRKLTPAALAAAVTLLPPISLVAQSQGGTTPPEQPTAPATRKPIRVSGGVMAAQCTHKVDPVTPPGASGTSGAIVLAVTVGADGAVKDAKGISGPEDLRKAAIDAVRQWTYKPFLLNGQPTDVLTTVTVNFH